ncbi:MAG: DNA-processing protein DprA [Rhodomicrobiaceae bacterium]
MSLSSLFRKGFAEIAGETPLPAPYLEMGAYEVLCLRPGATFKTLSEWIRAAPSGQPSDLVDAATAAGHARDVLTRLARAGSRNVDVRLFGAPDYPPQLRDARHPLRAFYSQGDWSLVDTPSVAVVGARQLSEDGVTRARRLVRHLVEDGFTIVSGLAAGTDTIVHTTALEAGGRTIAVLGTPIHKTYPRQNIELQRRIASEFLVISQVPVLLYEAKDWRYNRKFFPERNVTMSALTNASIIVEIGDSNGTYIQSKAALDQGRPLFLLNNCFSKAGISWPARFAERGAVRAVSYDDIGGRIAHLAGAPADPPASASA